MFQGDGDDEKHVEEEVDRNHWGELESESEEEESSESEEEEDEEKRKWSTQRHTFGPIETLAHGPRLLLLFS